MGRVMANGTVQYCGVNGCRNPIKQGAAGCWRHPDGMASDSGSGKAQVTMLDSDARKMAFESGLGQQDRSMYSPKLGVMSPTKMSERLLINGSSIAGDAARIVARVTEDISTQHAISVPEYVDRHQRVILDDYRSELENQGLNGRVTELKLYGITRLTPKGRRQSIPGIEHTALLIDPGNRQSSVVVDPTISRLTPVVDRSRSVLETYAVVGSPLADIPYVASPAEYVRGSYLWFDRAEAAQ